jgi:Protein of unknown function (DUF998)
MAVAAAVIVGVAGVLTPGYDPISRTVSRLAAPEMPAAPAVDAAIAAMGLACLLLAYTSRRGRVALSVAGLGFMAAAAIHLDPASTASTAAHRAASGIAVVALGIAPFAVGRAYGILSIVLGAVALAILVSAGALLMTPFTAWGAWERLLLGVQLCWMVTIALRIASADDTSRAPVAMVSNAGS